MKTREDHSKMNRLVIVLIFLFIIVSGLVVAQTLVDAEKIAYPVEKTTDDAKLIYTIEAEETARRLHNEVGLWTKQPIEQKVYDAWPEKVKTAIKFEEKKTLDLSTFYNFIETVWEPEYSQPVIEERLRIEEKIRQKSLAELAVTYADLDGLRI